MNSPSPICGLEAAALSPPAWRGLVKRSTTAALIVGLALAGMALAGCKRLPCMLPGTTCVKGIPFRSRNLSFHPAARDVVAKGTLAAPATLGGVTFVSGTELSFHDNGQVACGAVADMGQRQPALKHGSWVCFHRNGNLKSAELFAEHTIQGVVLKGTSAEPVEPSFHENGKLAHVRLRADTAIQGGVYRAKTEVWFHPSGRLESGELAADSAILGRTYLAGTKLRFLKANGGVAEGTLGSPAVIGGDTYERGTGLWFDEAGRLEKVRLLTDTTIHGITFRGNAVVPFYENGVAQHGVLAVATKVQDVDFADGTLVTFHRTGMLAEAQLSADTVINQRRFAAGTRIVCDVAGLCRPHEEEQPAGAPLPLVVTVGDNLRVKVTGNSPWTTGELVAPLSLGRNLLASGTRLWFDEQGRIEKAALDRDHELAGRPGLVTCKAGTEVRFDPELELRACVLGRDVTLDGRDYKLGRRLTFDGDGRVAEDAEPTVDAAQAQPPTEGASGGAPKPTGMAPAPRLQVYRGGE
jgi:hypothetical protein